MKKIIPVLILFISCNSAKQAVKSIDKGFNKDSAAAYKRVRQIVPCISTFIDTGSVKTIIKTKYDTTREVRDTIITLPCKDGTTVSTKITTETFRIREHTTITNTYFITKTIEDKGKDIVIRDIKVKYEELDRKKHFWQYWAIITTLIILVIVIFFLLSRSLKARP